jgi:Lon protease-like protein
VLFPGELLPLHIFEPRYRQLLADCLEGDQRFGITAADPPGPGAVGCVARIRAAEPLPDGRSNILVLGERRFGVRALLNEQTPYLVATVDEFGDEQSTAPLPSEHAELRRLAGKLRDALRILTDQPEAETEWAEDAEAFSFQVAALSELELAARLRLLAGRSTRDRARALLAMLPAVVTETRIRAETHVRARSNGSGHRGTDIVTE